MTNMSEPAHKKTTPTQLAQHSINELGSSWRAAWARDRQTMGQNTDADEDRHSVGKCSGHEARAALLGKLGRTLSRGTDCSARH